METNLKVHKVNLLPAKCALDLGDGSERGEYVSQDYIINKLGRPHRNINLMYTYYPNDKQWPERISVACKDMNVTYQWDYPNDDYFPYGGGSKGSTKGEPFTFMRDIRKHGQDITLTLTMDCSLPDKELYYIANELKTFGRMKLRINHECAGTWFTHNQRFTYKEIADFFVRFHNIIKEVAPNIQTVFCAGFSLDDSEVNAVSQEEDFLEAYKVADVWSADRYLALHYGWPYDVCEKGGTTYSSYSITNIYEIVKKTAARLNEINGGVSKPFVISELNTDGDVTGPMKQGESIKKFAYLFRDNNTDCLNGFTMYQFRDRGRLGLEVEDPNNSSVGIEQPILKDYKEIMYDPYFMHQFDVNTDAQLELPFPMRWGSAEDAEGVGLALELDTMPVFCEIEFEESLNLMMELNGRWFYKAPNTKVVDLMPAFFDSTFEGPKNLVLKLFAPPATGENDTTQGEDWNYNYTSVITKMPKLRIRYESIADVK